MEITNSSTAPIAPITTPEFSAEQQAKMADWAVADGHLTRETAAQMLGENAHLMTPVKHTEGPAAEVDALFPPAKASEFQIPKLGDGENVSPRDLGLIKHGQGWLSDAKLPASIGNAVAAEAKRVSDMNSGMSDADRVSFQTRERAFLTRLWGDQAPQKIELANQLVAEIEAKRPGLFDFLQRTGAGNSAMIIAQFANHAERLKIRNGIK
jgi:hypothetical protein